MLLVLFFGTMPAVSAADRFFIETINIEPGETRQLVLSLDNTQPYYGFQADIVLPEGLGFVIENGKPQITLSARADNYAVVSNLVSESCARIGAFSLLHRPVDGESGALAFVAVRAADNFAGGVVSLSNVMFADADGNDADFADSELAIGTKHVDSLYIPDFSISSGQSKTIDLVLDNESSFTAFQTDLYVPEGLAVTDDSFVLASRASSGHALSVKRFDDGHFRIICMSMNNDVFSGNSGAILTFEVTAEQSAAHDLVIELKNNIFSTADAREYVLPVSSCSVTLNPVETEGVKIVYTGSDTLLVGEKVQLGVEFMPANATDKRVSWVSENDEVMTVDSNGLVTALRTGSCWIGVFTPGSPYDENPVSDYKYDLIYLSVTNVDGVDDIELDRMSVTVVNHTVFVSGLSAGVQVQIYGLDGRLIDAAVSSGEILNMQVRASGCYIVRGGTDARKISVK